MSGYGRTIITVARWVNSRTVPASELAAALQSIPAEYLDVAELNVDTGLEYDCPTVDTIELVYARPRTKEEKEADDREQRAYMDRLERQIRERDYAQYQALKARFGGV